MWCCFMRGLKLAHGNKEPPSEGSPVKGSAESPPKTERLWQSTQHFSFTAQAASPPSFVPACTDCEIICATCAWREPCVGGALLLLLPVPEKTDCELICATCAWRETCFGATRLQFIQLLCGSGSL